MTSLELIARFHSLGLNSRLLLQLEKAQVIKRTRGGPGRSLITEYSDHSDGLRDLEFVLLRIKAGSSLSDAQFALAVEKTPAALFASDDPFLSFAAMARLGDTQRIFWGPDEGVAQRFLVEQRIGVLLAEWELPERPGQPAEHFAAERLASVASARHIPVVWIVPNLGRLPSTALPDKHSSLQKPVTGDRLAEAIRLALRTSAPTSTPATPPEEPR